MALMKSVLPLVLCSIPAGILCAADQAPAADASPWSHHLKFTAHISSVSTSNAEASNDATISGTDDNATYTLTLDGRLKWERGPQSIQNDAILKFGRKYDELEKWRDSTDQIDYDGVYKYNISKAHNYYFSIGYDSVFTGPEPEEDALDPATGKVATGYAFKLTNILPEKDAFETRVGARAQRSWGDNASDEQKETTTGLEWVTRYERTQNKQLNYFAQYEFFTEFEDTGHMTHLLTAGLNYKINTLFSIKFDVRAYMETEPDDLDSTPDDDTYDTWAIRQETTIGFYYEF